MNKRTGSGFSLPVSLSKRPSTCLAFSHKYGKIKKDVMEMLKKGTEEREQYELICIDDLILENHVLRKIDAAIDFILIFH